MPTIGPVGVIGTGAMGMGVVQSLLRAGFVTHARDLRPDAQTEAASLGAVVHPSAASLAEACNVAIVLVVDAAEIDEVLFGAAGAASAFRRDSIVVISSTVAPDYLAALEPRLAAQAIALVDAPISGGPARAADGTMTMMIAGSAAARERCSTLFAAMAAKIFHVGTVPGEAAKFKIVNNLLAAVNLAAGAEALALAIKAGLDPWQVVDVVNASSGGSWIFADRMPRAISGDYAPRAATKILAKDVTLATELAAANGIDVPFALAARAAFRATIAAGYGDQDDAAIFKYMTGPNK